MFRAAKLLVILLQLAGNISIISLDQRRADTRTWHSALSVSTCHQHQDTMYTRVAVEHLCAASQQLLAVAANH